MGSFQGSVEGSIQGIFQVRVESSDEERGNEEQEDISIDEIKVKSEGPGGDEGKPESNIGPRPSIWSVPGNHKVVAEDEKSKSSDPKSVGCGNMKNDYSLKKNDIDSLLKDISSGQMSGSGQNGSGSIEITGMEFNLSTQLRQFLYPRLQEEGRA